MSRPVREKKYFLFRIFHLELGVTIVFRERQKQ